MTTRAAVLSAAVAAAAALVLAGCSNDAPSAAPSAPAASSAAPTSAAPSGVPATVPAGAPALEQAYVGVVKQVLPSVVQITTNQGLGSGVVFDTKGNIVTNAHVVGNVNRFQVRLAGSPASIPASLVGAYPPDDLAVIHLDSPPSGLQPAHFGDSSRLVIGDIVLAMGSPLGLTGSVTNGIVSATGRIVTEPQSADSPGATLPNVVQTSAAINPGNSGGALVDLAGDVVGVPTLAALDPQTGGSAAPGIGFAIPSNLVTDIANQLITNNGRVVNSHRAALGLNVVTVVDQSGQPAGVGVEGVVTGGPAAAAGVQAGEVLTAVNNVPVRSTSELATVLAQLNPGQTVPVSLLGPQGNTRTLMVTLGQLPGT